jgi:hypothetical protein
MFSSRLVGSVFAVVTLLGVACDGGADDLDPSASANVTPATPQTEMELRNHAHDLFVALEPELASACARGCHDTGAINQRAPLFLSGAPDAEKAYLSIKAFPGIVLPDATESKILNKPQHDGEALANITNPNSADPKDSLNNRVQVWLTFEAAAIDKKIDPATDYIAANPGPIEFDLSKLGVAGVKLKGTVEISPGGILSLKALKVVVPMMGDKKGAHLVNPRFYRLTAKNKKYVDVSDYFSTVDKVFPGGAETALPPGDAIFTARDSWVPFAAGDKLQLTVSKLEEGTVVDAPVAQKCKDVAAFQAQLLPTLMGQMEGTGINCQGCHNPTRGQAPNLMGTADVVCLEVAARINRTTPAQSVIVMKPAGALGHAGGKVTNGAAFTTKWTNAINGKLIFPD